MDSLNPLRREALLHPTSESFLLHFFSGYQGRYWRYTHTTQHVDILPKFPREALITSQPWLYHNAYSKYPYLAEISLGTTEHGVDTMPCEGNLRLCLRVFDPRLIKVLRVDPVRIGLLRAKRYHDALPKYVVEMEHFYRDATMMALV